MPDNALHPCPPKPLEPCALPERVSVVIPVYQGALSLPQLLAEIAVLAQPGQTPGGARFVVDEVLLVHDCGPDDSARVLLALSQEHAFVRPVWLSRNFGQHAATLAGMASATGDWVVTLDEDGQHDPADIARLLDAAWSGGLQVAYGRAASAAPHGWLRNTASGLAKWLAAGLLGSGQARQFSSFRLMDGEIARLLAAYCNHGVYLDVALSWIAQRVGSVPVALRTEAHRPSGYSWGRLLSHFWRLVLTSGTRPLRWITLMGGASLLLSLGLIGYALYAKLSGHVAIQGWASLLIIISFFSGCILVALGVMAEYLAISLGIAMGKPLYLIVRGPGRGARGGPP